MFRDVVGISGGSRSGNRAIMLSGTYQCLPNRFQANMMQETTPSASNTPPAHVDPSSSGPTSSLLSSPPCFTMYIPARIKRSAPNGVHHKRSRPGYLSSSGHLPRKKTSKTIKSFFRAAGKTPIQLRGPSGKGDCLSAAVWVGSDMETSDEGNEGYVCCE